MKSYGRAFTETAVPARRYSRAPKCAWINGRSQTADRQRLANLPFRRGSFSPPLVSDWQSATAWCPRRVESVPRDDIESCAQSDSSSHAGIARTFGSETSCLPPHTTENSFSFTPVQVGKTSFSFYGRCARRS